MTCKLKVTKKLRRLQLSSTIAVSLSLAACGDQTLNVPDSDFFDPGLTTQSLDIALGRAFSAAKIKFHSDSFHTRSQPNSFGCAGDIKKYYDPLNHDALGAVELPQSIDYPSETIAPAFIVNSSVDITNSNLDDPANISFGCALVNMGEANECAGIDFSEFFTNQFGYQTGFYTMFDKHCFGVGTVVEPEPEDSKNFIGGAYINLRRSELEPDEDLLLNLTYFSLGRHNVDPNGFQMTDLDTPLLRIHLVSSGGLTKDSYSKAFQPRAHEFFDKDSYPRTVYSVAILSEPTGVPSMKQIHLPISINSTIDQIRIERDRGSAILSAADIYRTKGGVN